MLEGMCVYDVCGVCEFHCVVRVFLNEGSLRT